MVDGDLTRRKAHRGRNNTEGQSDSMLEVMLLGLVSVVLWAVVAYAYWYSIKKTYGMRQERAQADTESSPPDEQP